MNLAERKAYSLLAAYFQTTRRFPTLTASTLRPLSDNVLSIARQAFETNCSRDLDRFLQESIERAGAATTALKLPSHDDIAPVIDDLRRSCAELDCRVCAGGDVCNGAERDSLIVEAQDGGLCIRDVKEALRLGLRLAKGAYAGLAVKVALSTEAASQPTALLPGLDVAANAGTWFEDEGERRISHVTVRLAPLGLNRMTLAAMPYVLAHEVCCHAAQMDQAPGPRANKTGITDPVAEGMMDALTVDLMQRDAEAPSAGVRCVSEEEADVARQIHLARASLIMEPPFPEATEVALGVHIRRAVIALYAQDGGKPEADAQCLVCDLNRHPWTFSQRFAGLNRLSAMLRSRDIDALDLLLTYRRRRRCDDLVTYITNS